VKRHDACVCGYGCDLVLRNGMVILQSLYTLAAHFNSDAYLPETVQNLGPLGHSSPLSQRNITKSKK